jgi:predicted enzyme related to lactoylglutathione lyase
VEVREGERRAGRVRRRGGRRHPRGDAGASPYVFFRVDDLDAALARVEELGGAREPAGEDHGDEDQAARFGRFALCRDDQGSAFGLHEPPAARAPR